MEVSLNGLSLNSSWEIACCPPLLMEVSGEHCHLLSLVVVVNVWTEFDQVHQISLPIDWCCTVHTVTGKSTSSSMKTIFRWGHHLKSWLDMDKFCVIAFETLSFWLSEMSLSVSYSFWIFVYVCSKIYSKKKKGKMKGIKQIKIAWGKLLAPWNFYILRSCFR